MKPLTYNSPERATERAEVVPLSDEELKYIPYFLNKICALFEVHLEGHPLGMKEDYEKEYNLVQRLLYEHENLRHLSENIGGWQGLNALQVNYEIVKHT